MIDNFSKKNVMWTNKPFRTPSRTTQHSILLIWTIETIKKSWKFQNKERQRFPNYFKISSSRLLDIWDQFGYEHGIIWIVRHVRTVVWSFWVLALFERHFLMKPFCFSFFSLFFSFFLLRTFFLSSVSLYFFASFFWWPVSLCFWSSFNLRNWFLRCSEGKFGLMKLLKKRRN